jgi:hydroxyacylglutathione hydrolase
VTGYLSGGMTSWREEQKPVERVGRATVEELHDRWEEDRQAIQVLDVREQAEWDRGHIPGSIHKPYHDIHELPDEVDRERPVAVICGSGQRSAVAASLLKRFGAGDVIHVFEGGVPRWRRKGWPVER